MGAGPVSLADWREGWQLVADGAPVETASSFLQPVIAGRVPAFLKIARIEEERRGNAAMAWWSARLAGVAPVLSHEGPALLMARARGAGSLADLARRDDAAAIGILCGIIAGLHEQEEGEPSGEIPAGMRPLQDCFTDLFEAARGDARLAASAEAADLLLAEADEAILLHGDIHHANVLDFGEGGWRAIDPKGLIGPRAFDYANLFCNPVPEIAADPQIFAARLGAVAQLAGLERTELARWILAWAGLSAVWMEADGLSAETPLAVIPLARAVI